MSPQAELRPRLGQPLPLFPCSILKISHIENCAAENSPVFQQTANLKITSSILVIIASLTLSAIADNPPTSDAKPAPAKNDAPAVAPKADSADAKPPAREKQGDVASATATFGKIAKTDDAYKSALDAHALDDALKMVDKDGAFKGTVAKVFEPRGLAIVEFDNDYKTALTAIVRGTNFSNFPALTNLIGKEVLVTGKFIKYRDAAEMVLDKPDQVKLAQ